MNIDIKGNTRRRELNRLGFPISYKENELRRIILPQDIESIEHPEMITIERGYGKVLGISDRDYLEKGVRVARREDVLKSDIICDCKVGDADYLPKLKNQTVFGWVHATQSRRITDTLMRNELSAFAWENMNSKGQHIFWKNNELAGEAAILHSFMHCKVRPHKMKVAVLGRGNAARGAIGILSRLGSDITVFTRKTISSLPSCIDNFDCIVNCVKWDITRKDHIIYRSDLQKMKKGSLIVDVSCDRHGAIETSIPTTIRKPTYKVDGIIHYVVDHTPALLHRKFSIYHSKLLIPYYNELIAGKTGRVLTESKIMEDGEILDEEIIIHQNRDNLRKKAIC